MYQYFKTLQQVAETDHREFNGIKDLTIALAINSGYKREIKKCVDGINDTKYVISTYTNWDEPLVAKWLLYFKNKIVSTLVKQPNLQPYYYDIIQRTFFYTFQSLKLDKVVSDSFVVACFNKMFSVRIAEAFHNCGTPGRFERLVDGTQKNAMKMKNAIFFNSVSIDKLAEEHNIQLASEGSNYETNPLIMSLYNIFSQKPTTQYQALYNSVGKRLLEAMLDAKQQREVNPDKIAAGKDVETPEDRGKITTERIREYIEFKDSELESEVAKQATVSALSDAYQAIKETLKNHLDEEGYNTDKYNWDEIPTFKLNSDRASKSIATTYKNWYKKLAADEEFDAANGTHNADFTRKSMVSMGLLTEAAETSQVIVDVEACL